MLAQQGHATHTDAGAEIADASPRRVARVLCHAQSENVVSRLVPALITALVPRHAVRIRLLHGHPHWERSLMKILYSVDSR